MKRDESGTIRGRVKRIRETLNITQREMAARLGISKTKMSYIETGRSAPGYKFLKNIAAEYKVNPLYIQFGEGEPFNDTAGIAGEPTQSFPYQSQMDRFDRDFLSTYFRSLYVRFNMLAFFLKFRRENKDFIDEEIACYEQTKEDKC